MLRQVLDGEAQAAGAGRTDHEPVGPAWEGMVRQCVGKGLVILAEVFDVDARLGNARAPAGLEGEDGLVGVRFGHPAAHGTAAEPLILEEAEAVEILVAADFTARVPVQA